MCSDRRATWNRLVARRRQALSEFAHEGVRRQLYQDRNMTLVARSTLFLSSSASLLLGLGGTAMSQAPAPAGSGATALPGITVVAPHRVQPPRRPKTRVVTGQRRETPAAPPQTETQVVAGQNTKFDEARRTIDAPIGATSYQTNHQNIESLPQGNNASLDKGF